MSNLLLFDIDCTLINTGGAGMEALKLAAKQLFGAEGPELDLAGSTDLSIVRGMLEHFESDADEDAFFQAYLSYLPSCLESFSGHILPGADELLDKLQKNGATLGLLTGNVKRGAWYKLEHYGLSDYFAFGAFGDDHHDRNKLGPIALQRAQQTMGREFSPENTILIGDTPKDIACGKALGARVLAVATGGFSIAELIAYGAEFAREDLTYPDVFDILTS